MKILTGSNHSKIFKSFRMKKKKKKKKKKKHFLE